MLIFCIFLECWGQDLDISILLKERMLQQGLYSCENIFIPFTLPEKKLFPLIMRELMHVNQF